LTAKKPKASLKLKKACPYLAVALKKNSLSIGNDIKNSTKRGET
jgi:hypothetical protein